MTRHHLVYIAFFFPPSRASGVHRALATAREFIDSGWKVTVVTTTEDFFHREIGTVDRSLLESVPKEIEVIRIPFSLRGLSERKDLREYSRLPDPKKPARSAEISAARLKCKKFKNSVLVLAWLGLGYRLC